MSTTFHKYLIPCLALILLMGAGCRGSDRRAEEPTPDFPFGMEEPVTTGGDSDSDEGLSACANEYYPLRLGYLVQYRTQGPSGETTSQLEVTQIRGSDITVQSSFMRRESPTVNLALQYKCENGALVARGYADANSVTAADGFMARGAAIETIASEGEFMPARVSAGQTWGAKYSIKLTPTDRPDVLQERASPVTADVSITRTAIEKETITTPAGRFEAMKIASNTSFNGALAYTGYEWWVKGKGMVKSVQGNGSGAITTEATSIRTSSR